LGQTGETYIVNRDEMMVTQSRFVSNSTFAQKVDTPPVIECFKNGNSLSGIYSTYLKTPDKLGTYYMAKGGLAYHNYTETPVFGTSYCNRDSGFVLLGEIDVSELYSPLVKLQDNYTIMIVLISLGVLVASFFIVRHITRPLVKITHIAEKISHGDYAIYIKEQSSEDEIGRLYYSIKMILSKIRQSAEQVNNLNRELRIVNKELESKDNLNDNIINIISYEFENILQSILDFADLVKKRMISDDDAWVGILQNARKLKSLTIDISDLNKMKSGTLDYRFTKMHLNQTIRDATDSLKVNLSTGVNMKVIPDQKDPEIYADVKRITQMIRNIVEKTIQSIKHGSIKIEHHSNHPDKVDIVINVTGDEIPKYVLSNFIIDKSVPHDIMNETKPEIDLGLSIAKHIVIAHKGEIVYTDNIGEVTITVTLPINNTVIPTRNSTHAFIIL
jgi:signal transduction histidine kinase